MSVYSNNQYNKQHDDAWHKVFGFIEPKARVLDVGCSSGQLGSALKKEKDAYIVGLDIDKEDLKIAEDNLDKTYLKNVETDDVSSLGSFDVIIMADVIEHLVDPVNALKKLKQLLNKNGRLVFSIPNMANITTRLELLEGKFEYKDFGLLDRTHLHFYDEKEVNRVFHDAGFQVEATDCTVRNIPDNILRKELSQLGVELTPKLKKHLESTSGLIYQFIGYAVPAAKPKHFVPHTASPLDAVSREIDGIRAQYEALLAEREQTIQTKQQEIQTLAKTLNDIYESKGWKMLSKARNVKSHLPKNHNSSQ